MSEDNDGTRPDDSATNDSAAPTEGDGVRMRKSSLTGLQKGCLVGCALAVIVPAVLVGIGVWHATGLPETYTAEMTVTFDRPPAEVWAACLDYESNPYGGAAVQSIEPLEDVDGLPAWREDMQETTLEVVTTEMVEHERLVRELKDTVVPMSARSVVELEEVEDGTRMHVTHVVTISDGTWQVPFFRLIMHYGDGARAGAEAWVDGIEDVLNEGAGGPADDDDAGDGAGGDESDD